MYLLAAALSCLFGARTVCGKEDRDTPLPASDPKDDQPIAPAIAPISAMDSPTLADPLIPTSSADPSSSPTDSPSSGPTESPVYFEVNVVPMMFTVTTDGGQVNEKMLELDLEAILTNDVLQRVFLHLSHVDLNVSVSAPPTTRRHLEQNLQAEMEGIAYFTNETELPSSDQLNSFLSTYFTVLGSDDLTDLLADGNPAITAMELVTVDGDPMDDPSLEENSPNGAGSEQSSNDSTFPPAAIAGVVAGCLVLVLAFGMLLWYKRRSQHGGAGKRRSTDPSNSAAGLAKSLPTAGGNDSTFLVENVGDDEDLSVDVSLGGSSIYTSNSNSFHAPKASQLSEPQEQALDDTGEKYDASRLDKVIQSAKEECSKDDMQSPDKEVAQELPEDSKTLTIATTL